MGKVTRKCVSAVLSAWHEYFNIAPISTWLLGTVQIYHLGLLLEVLPRNVGVTFLVYLLLSCHSKGNISLKVFGLLEMAAIMSIWLVLRLWGCFVTSCLKSGS